MPEKRTVEEEAGFESFQQLIRGKYFFKTKKTFLEWQSFYFSAEDF